jgi:hypothetical protein
MTRRRRVHPRRIAVAALKQNAITRYMYVINDSDISSILSPDELREEERVVTGVMNFQVHVSVFNRK